MLSVGCGVGVGLLEMCEGHVFGSLSRSEREGLVKSNALVGVSE